ncbi:MAG: hypothetical protein PHP59_00975 [Methanofollis sp.]|uniref:hypothetical protein n=1 Tax=Methanofollis sp. TaxID=2052835 RepID=UPI00263343E2|nr:hypothetical protein [Methanofollis sp.]MDD4253932.1 hypothetical protein [Methanofollis sp.]
MQLIRSRETPDTDQMPGDALAAEYSGGGAYSYETARVWEMAGFIPPAVCQAAVEALHLQGMEEETDRDGFPRLARDIIMQAGEIRDRCVITDPVRLRETALDWGVPAVGMSDREIAYLMTLLVIADYCTQP